MNQEDELLKNLKIGTAVFVLKTSYFDYDTNNRRVEFFKPFGKKAYICGRRRKAIGTYNKGFSYSGIDGWDRTPPSLTVEKYVYVYECRERLDSVPILVNPDHILPIIAAKKSNEPRR